MLTITQSQKAIVRQVENALKEREIVCLWGNVPNGKTHIHSYLVGKHTVGLENKSRSSIIPSNASDYSLEMLEGIEITTISEKIHIDRIKRNILEVYGEPCGENILKMHRRYTNLLLDLKEARIMPVLIQDGVEVMPGRAYSIYKLLNQYYHKGEHIGIAHLLTGEFSKRKMPPNFWNHISEVKIGKVLPEEVAEFMSEVAPRHKNLFTEAALKRLTTAPTTAEMKRLIRKSIEYWENYLSHTEKIDVPIIRRVSEELIYAKQRMAA
jgi:hypothetical protein